ncbi:MAG: hypothetical protein WBP12_02090 [Candidatus Saccharimonas sp.]
MHDTSKAQPVLDDHGNIIGYVLEIAENQWLPLNLEGANYTGPSHHNDAIDIVKLKHASGESAVN